MSSAFYKLALDKAKDDGIIDDLKSYELDANATVTMVENADFIKKMQVDIQNNAARNSDMERGIKNMCNALSEEFQCLHSTVKDLNCSIQHLKNETDVMGEAVDVVRNNVDAVHNNQNQLRTAMLRKLRVESGVAFASIILNAVTLGAAGPALQGFANLSICSIVDFSDLAHVRKVLTSDQVETVESIAFTDMIE
jgi:archaellum component FlaC